MDKMRRRNPQKLAALCQRNGRDFMQEITDSETGRIPADCSRFLANGRTVENLEQSGGVWAIPGRIHSYVILPAVHVEHRRKNAHAVVGKQRGANYPHLFQISTVRPLARNLEQSAGIHSSLLSQ